MNLNGEEKRLQQLFREVSRDDQRRAPQFAGVLAAARSGMARSRNRTRSLRFAIAVTMLCLAMLIAMVVVLMPLKSRGLTARDNQGSAPPAQLEAPPSVPPSQPGVVATNIAPRKAIITRARHQRTSDSLAMSMKSLSSWQSPTASLLKTPVDELLRSLPRLGESLQTIKPFSFDQFN